MLKAGKYRAFRNIPVGWLTQAIHSTDRSERTFRIVIELLSLGLLLFLMQSLFSPYTLVSCLIVVMINHTLMWFLTGNFWVYMLDSFLWVKNGGVHEIIRFTQFIKKTFTRIDCVDAILIYGSMCRNQLHIRSDLDLRVVRRVDGWKGLLALPIGFVVRAYSFFIRMPVDLEVVDSMEFLGRQMRDDEKPLIVYVREGFVVHNPGRDFAEVVDDPSTVLKKEMT